MSNTTWPLRSRVQRTLRSRSLLTCEFRIGCAAILVKEPWAPDAGARSRERPRRALCQCLPDLDPDS